MPCEGPIHRVSGSYQELVTGQWLTRLQGGEWSGGGRGEVVAAALSRRDGGQD